MRFTPVPSDGAIDGVETLRLKMNDDAASTIVIDSSTNVFNGTAQANTNTLSVDGVFDTALSFDGTVDYITVPHDTALNPGTGDYTICFWMYKTSEGLQRISAKLNGAGNNGWRLNATTFFELEMTKSGRLLDLQSLTAITPSTWTHIAIVVDRTTLSSSKIYIDGVSVSTLLASATLLVSDDVNPTDDLLVGEDSSGVSKFSGDIDEFRIYNQKLTQAEITQIYERNEVISGATWNVNGRLGFCLTFDGTNDFVNVGSNSSILINNKTQFTVEAFVKVDSTGSSNRVIMGNDNGSAGYYLRVTSTGKIEFFVEHATTDLDYITTASITNDTWVLVQAVYNTNQSADIYFDGVEQSYSTMTSGVGSISDDTGLAVNIGRRGGGSNDMYFKGNIDEVKFYNTALSCSTALDNFNSPRSPSMFGLVAWWGFNEGTGSTAEDGDVQYYDTPIKDSVVDTAISDFNTSSTFGMNLDNSNGNLSDAFNIGNEIVIYAEKDVNPPRTTILAGKIGDLVYKGIPNYETLEISGRDYTGALQDYTIEPEVYNNQEISLIILDFMPKYAPGITTNNVQTTTVTLERVVFLQKNVFDGLKYLAEQSNCYFYVDSDKDLHFGPQAAVDSELTFDSTNITNSNLNVTDDQLWNKIYVYGDRLLSGHSQSFTADGAGSVYTLTYKPHNTTVTVSGVQKSGGIFQMADSVSNVWSYLVNYDSRQIILTSGTQAGNNLAASGVTVAVDYFRDTPIIKLAEDPSSQEKYGIRTKIITSKDIRDPSQAVDVANNQLALYSAPIMQGDLNLHDIFGVTAGELCTVDLPFEGINSTKYLMIKATYNFNIENNLSNNVLKVTVSAKRRTIMDLLKQIMLDLKRLEGSDISTDDVITRIQTSNGSVGIRVAEWIVKSRTIGHSFILGHPINGKLGSPYNGIDGSQILLGDYRSAFTVQRSGTDNDGGTC
jgi:prophage tail gpP-like protein